MDMPHIDELFITHLWFLVAFIPIHPEYGLFNPK